MKTDSVIAFFATMLVVCIATLSDRIMLVGGTAVACATMALVEFRRHHQARGVAMVLGTVLGLVLAGAYGYVQGTAALHG